MKSEEKTAKDPIKDKYNVKVGFFKTIQLKFLNVFNKAKENKSIKEDAADFANIAVYVALSGVLGSFFMSLPYFGQEISIMSIIGIGSGLWLIENKFTPIVSNLLGSIKLVQINN